MLSRRCFDVSSSGLALLLFLSLSIVLRILPCDAFGFITIAPRASSRTTPTLLHDTSSSTNDNDDTDDPVREAQRLLDRARQIRESLDSTKEITSPSSSTSTVGNNPITSTSRSSSPFTISTNDDNDNSSSSVGYYRLYVDIGREKGTWMEPRWGASGNRIAFSIDVRFSSARATEEIENGMVTDNFGGRSSDAYVLKTAPCARLRGGFDKMACYDGGYRFDTTVDNRKRRRTTVRFYVGVEGAEETYGDVFVPKGGLYFSIPCFGQKGAEGETGVVVSNLSTKEYPVTVRMMGWNTGWRRMESRMVGVYRAVPIEQARMRDQF